MASTGRHSGAQQENSTQSVFAQLDRVTPELHKRLVNALDRMAKDPQIQRVRQVARDILAPRPGHRLLDAGCGLGEEARTLAAMVAADGEVMAVDHSAATMSIAAQRHDGSRVDYAVGDIGSLDFPDGCFDGVRAERVLQHLAEPDAAVAELIRVTRPGGRVCLVDTDWQSLAMEGLPQDLVDTMMDHFTSGPRAHSPDMGRTLRRRLLRAGLTGIICEPVPLHFSSPEAAAVVIPLFNPDVPRETGLIPDELWDSWFSAINTAAKKKEFLAVLTIWAVGGVKPAMLAAA